MREIMENEEGTGTVVEIGSTRRRKAPVRKSVAASRRKPAARSKAKAKTPARRKRAAGGTSFEGVIRSITAGVTVAREAIAEASGQGATAVRRAVGSASKASRKTVTRLANEWKSMDPKKKAGVLAALLGAAAAASAPLVRKSLKK
jgi:hypothetical protein